MNRRAGLRRHTPLIARTGLVRGGSLLRAAPLLSSGPIKARRPAMTPEEHAAKHGVNTRSEGCCEIGIDGVCVGVGCDFSHRIAAGRGGKWRISNGLKSCRPCHISITNTNGRRAEYEWRGYIVRTGQDTTLRQVLHARRGWVWLDDHGGTRPAPTPARGTAA